MAGVLVLRLDFLPWKLPEEPVRVKHGEQGRTHQTNGWEHR
jgi:hypothetical protein